MAKDSVIDKFGPDQRLAATADALLPAKTEKVRIAPAAAPPRVHQAEPSTAAAAMENGLQWVIVLLRLVLATGATV